MNSNAMNPERIAELIRAGLPGATVRVESDDNTHFASQIVAEQFAGLRPIARHQLSTRPWAHSSGGKFMRCPSKR